MLTKVLITALVIAACFTYARYQRGKNASANEDQGRATQTPTKKQSMPSQIQWLSGGLIVLTATAAIGFFVYNWKDDHRVMIVNIINPQSGEVSRYEVYKGDLQERSFTTLQGQKIRLGNTERLEVRERR